MKEYVIKELLKLTPLSKEEIESKLEIPPSSDLGDYAFPCFILSSKFKKHPNEIAQDLVSKIETSSEIEKVEVKGPYLNFFINKRKLAERTLSGILSQKDKYGSSKSGKGKTLVIDLSSPNIAKPFGIGHLRSTIIGNSISKIADFLGYKTIKINYLGDWGTQFGKLIVGYKRFGDDSKLKKDPIKHMLDLYVKANDEDYEAEAREWFKKMEQGNKEALSLWNRFRELSLKDFEKIYSVLGVKFNVISGESLYNNKLSEVVSKLEKKGLLEESEGARVVNLEKYNLGVCLIQKSDSTTLYATRDLAAAIDRYNKYTFYKMIYEVGQEQTLHFKQVFKVLQLLGYKWAEDCVHVSHGFYLDSEGKKFATRKGKTVFMQDILDEAISLAKKEILKREQVSGKELESRARAIALSAILYGDLKNFRTSDVLFDINRFLSFEGNTGPYLLYSYARARSILRKAKYKRGKIGISKMTEEEKSLTNKLSNFPMVVEKSHAQLSPNIIANYSFELSQMFNKFYHKEKVLGSEQEEFKLLLVDCFSQVLKNSLSILGIPVLEKM